MPKSYSQAAGHVAIAPDGTRGEIDDAQLFRAKRASLRIKTG